MSDLTSMKASQAVKYMGAVWEEIMKAIEKLLAGKDPSRISLTRDYTSMKLDEKLLMRFLGDDGRASVAKFKSERGPVLVYEQDGADKMEGLLKDANICYFRTKIDAKDAEKDCIIVSREDTEKVLDLERQVPAEFKIMDASQRQHERQTDREERDLGDREQNKKEKAVAEEVRGSIQAEHNERRFGDEAAAARGHGNDGRAIELQKDRSGNDAARSGLATESSVDMSDVRNYGNGDREKDAYEKSRTINLSEAGKALLYGGLKIDHIKDEAERNRVIDEITNTELFRQYLNEPKDVQTAVVNEISETIPAMLEEESQIEVNHLTLDQVKDERDEEKDRDDIVIDDRDDR